MEFLIYWGVSVALGMVGAIRNGYSFAIAFLGAFLLGPFSLFMWFVKPSTINCPACRKTVDRKAIVCGYCRRELKPA